jgi:hypothetical protein
MSKRSTTERRIEAVARQEEWANLSPAEQLAELDRRLGKGIGAKKQRARITKALNKGKVKS